MSEGRGRPDFFDFYRGVIEGRRRSDFLASEARFLVGRRPVFLGGGAP